MGVTVLEAMGDFAGRGDGGGGIRLWIDFVQIVGLCEAAVTLRMSSRVALT